MTHITAICDILFQTLPYWGIFISAFAMSLALTPIVRNLHARLGMVDCPSKRRINSVPIPRGGGVAVILSFVLVTVAFVLFFGKPVSPAIKTPAPA